jgi:hypothetical protein
VTDAAPEETAEAAAGATADETTDGETAG